jgi:hypothetical protein
MLERGEKNLYYLKQEKIFVLLNRERKITIGPERERKNLSIKKQSKSLEYIL